MRLFTFGCSFTWWPWPTWADIIAYELQLPYYNWGHCGVGNVAIHSRMIECDLQNKFEKDDIILTVWSSWTREDRYDVNHSNFARPSWNSTGDILYSYDKKFIDSYWSMNNDVIKNSTAIISANKMFDIKFNGHISTPLSDCYDDESLYFTDHEKTIAKFYQPYIPNDGEYEENKKHRCNYPNIHDSHPDILAHLDYTQEFLAPKLNITLSKTTIDFFTEMHYYLYDFTENNIDGSDGDDFRRQLPSVFEKFNWREKNIESSY